jgi:hypothetical protein
LQYRQKFDSGKWQAFLSKRVDTFCELAKIGFVTFNVGAMAVELNCNLK